MARDPHNLRWRTIVAPAVLCTLGLAIHLAAPRMGWGLVGALGGGGLGMVGGLLLVGSLHGRRLVCPACDAHLPFGPGDGHIVACPDCGAHLRVSPQGLHRLSEPPPHLHREA